MISAVLSCPPVAATALDAPPPLPEALVATAKAAAVPAKPDSTPRFYVQEYRVEGGGHLLSRDETEAAVYPFMGPYRTAADVEQARAALEQAYRDKGFETVTVQVPPQHARSGIVVLEVNPGEVGRLRVVGSRYFSIDQIKAEAPSLQEGTSPNFTQVKHDLVVLNELSDRQVSPVLRAGEIPGTVDVDLNVKDSPPLHGSLELNNRYSVGTTALRVNGSVNYDNLWQLGHSIGASFQVSPEDVSQVKVFSGYYLAHVPDVSWLSLEAQGTYQDSNVNTLGGIGVVGNGSVIGGRAILSLPQLTSYYESLSLGLDYKRFTQLLNGSDGKSIKLSAPVTYYPFSAAYSGTWIDQGDETDLNASVNWTVRGLGSSDENFDVNRQGADSGFVYFRGDLAHTHDLQGGAQVFVKAQGQASGTPLVSSEQFSGGGLGTVRGYLESEDVGDNGIFGSAELRTPSLGDFIGKPVDDWRVYVFAEGGLLTIQQPLPEQEGESKLASFGAGSRIKLQDHYNGSIDLGIPLIDSTNIGAWSPHLTFRLWAEF